MKRRPEQCIYDAPKDQTIELDFILKSKQPSTVIFFLIITHNLQNSTTLELHNIQAHRKIGFKIELQSHLLLNSKHN